MTGHHGQVSCPLGCRCEDGRRYTCIAHPATGPLGPRAQSRKRADRCSPPEQPRRGRLPHPTALPVSSGRLARPSGRVCAIPVQATPRAQTCAGDRPNRLYLKGILPRGLRRAAALSVPSSNSSGSTHTVLNITVGGPAAGHGHPRDQEPASAAIIRERCAYRPYRRRRRLRPL